MKIGIIGLGLIGGSIYRDLKNSIMTLLLFLNLKMVQEYTKIFRF